MRDARKHVSLMQIFRWILEVVPKFLVPMCAKGVLMTRTQHSFTNKPGQSNLISFYKENRNWKKKKPIIFKNGLSQFKSIFYWNTVSALTKMNCKAIGGGDNVTKQNSSLTFLPQSQCNFIQHQQTMLQVREISQPFVASLTCSI